LRRELVRRYPVWDHDTLYRDRLDPTSANSRHHIGGNFSDMAVTCG
jgi:hypothetical protein